MKSIARILFVALLSATIAFAQSPGRGTSVNHEALTTYSLAPSQEVSAESGEADGPTDQLIDAPEQVAMASASGVADPSLNSGDDSSSSRNGSVPPEDPGNLHIFVVPGYLWLSGLNGYVGAKGITIPVNASFSDVFDNLNIGYMGAADVRYRRIGLLTDVVYIKLTTQEQSTPLGLLYSTARTRAKQFFVEPDVYGRIVDTKAFSADAIAGVRVWRLENGIDLRAGVLPALSVDSTNVWADPVLGARFRVNLKKGLFATFKGDAGVGPNETWQIYAGGGKEFKQKYSLMLAYRRLDVDYSNGGFLYDTSMSGVLLGFGIRFK